MVKPMRGVLRLFSIKHWQTKYLLFIYQTKPALGLLLLVVLTGHVGLLIEAHQTLVVSLSDNFSNISVARNALSTPSRHRVR